MRLDHYWEKTDLVYIMTEIWFCLYHDRKLILSISRQKTDCVYYHDRKLILSISRQKTDCVYYHDKKLILSLITTENWFVLVSHCVGSAYWSDIFTKSFSTEHLVHEGCRMASGVEFWWRNVLVLNEEPSRCRSILISSIGLNFIAMKINEAVKFFWFIWCFKWC